MEMILVEILVGAGRIPGIWRAPTVQEKFNVEWRIGDWIIHDPDKVIRLGLRVFPEDIKLLSEMWVEAEQQVKEEMDSFNSEELFLQEEKGVHDFIVSTRYYTPKNNRHHSKDNKEMMN